MAATVHVIGAGLAGLSAAVQLAKEGAQIALYEAAGQPGGRCRSFYDDKLSCRIDNGNHLLLSGNHATLEYLKQIGAENVLVGPEQAEFPFVDIQTDERWSIKPDKGLIPWSLISGRGRVPGSSFGEYVRGLRLAFASNDQTVSQCLKGDGPLFERFWEPLAVSVLNTEADTASAKLLWPVLRETFGRGAAACIPLIVREGLSECFVDPALDCLAKFDSSIAFGKRLKTIGFENNRVSYLDFGDNQITITENDTVILAVPPTIAGTLVPDIQTPNDFRAIVNGHFRLPHTEKMPRFLGLVGSSSHWLFLRGNMASITVSAATELVSLSSEEIANRLWDDVCKALDLGNCPLGEYRIIKEKRATFAQTPEQIKLRPDTKTSYKNLFLAGDWTNTGLPATIEGTIRSGQKAAKLVKVRNQSL